MHDPERLDLSSASGAYRRRRCTGSENLIRELRARNLLKEIPETADQQSGTRVHAAWAGAQVELSSNQQRTLEELKRLEALVLADWSVGTGQGFHLLAREERYWLRNGIIPVHSGQCDCVYVSDDFKRALVLDAKTLYGQVEPAEHNDQLREEVALLRFNYRQIEHYTVAILAPNSTPSVSIATYDVLEARLALRLLWLNLNDSADPAAPRIPGAWCAKCPAQLQCEELLALVPRQKEALGPRIEAGDFQLPLGERGARLLEEIKTVKAVIKSLEEAYKQELGRDPDCLPGWYLKDGKKVRHITNIDSALEKWLEARLAMSDFLSATELSVTKLQESFGLAKGLRGRRLAEEFNSLLGQTILIRQNAPELVRTNKALPPQS